VISAEENEQNEEDIRIENERLQTENKMLQKDLEEAVVATSKPNKEGHSSEESNETQQVYVLIKEPAVATSQTLSSLTPLQRILSDNG